MSVAGIPYSVLENYPAGTPPPGVKPNFVDPPSHHTELIVLNTIFLSLMWIVVLMRLYAKGRILRNMGWDDYTCVLAALASSAHTAAELNCLRLGFGRHIWDIRVTTLLKLSNVRQLNATSIIYPVVIYCVKISILLLYLRIFGVNRPLRLSCYFAIVFFTLFYIAYLGVQAGFSANCMSVASQSLSLCKNVYSLTVFQSAFNVASDVFVFALPIPLIMKLHVSKRQKFGLLVIFLAGLVACGVSIARLVVTVNTLKRADKLWYGAITASLTVVEMNLAIIAACMSTLPGVLVKIRNYGSSVYKSLRSLIPTTRSGPTSTASWEEKSEERSDISGAITVPRSHKTLENTNYVQLGDGASSRVGTGDPQNADNRPLWSNA